MQEWFYALLQNSCRISTHSNFTSIDYGVLTAVCIALEAARNPVTSFLEKTARGGETQNMQNQPISFEIGKVTVFMMYGTYQRVFKNELTLTKPLSCSVIILAKSWGAKRKVLGFELANIR